MSRDTSEYIGNELELFAAAKNWKQYVASIIKPFIKGDGLEAGAGIGSNTSLFFSANVNTWVLLEPDKNFTDQLKIKLAENKLPRGCPLIQSYQG